MKYAILAVLCLATTVFGAIGYDGPTKTLTYGAASDLSTMVDPLGEGQDLTDPATMMGNLTKNAFNALSGLQVIDFNVEITAKPQFNPTSTINAAYDASHALTLTNFGDPNGYNYGGGTSNGRVQYSGANVWNQLGTVEGAVGAIGTFHLPPEGIAMNWFAADLSVNEANAGVSAVGFVVDSRSDQTTGAGNIWVTLSDASEVSFPYVTFGGTDPATAPLGIGFFYQADAGKFITRVECTRDSGGGNSYTALDDLGFVISRTGVTQPHPGDANNDGAVGVVDLGILARNYDWVGIPELPIIAFGRGDFNDDGKVDVIDLGTLARNYDWTGAPAGAVPEPMTLSLLAVGAAALIRRKR